MLRRSEIEKRLSGAAERACPDMVDELIAQSPRATGKVAFPPRAAAKRARPQRLAAMAAAIAILLTVGGYWFENGMVAAVVDLDVNPSVELTINRQNRVIRATPVNEDARALLQNMDLANANVDVAVNAIIGAMFTRGYLKEDADSVLISVDADSADRGAAILGLAAENAQAALNTALGGGAVLAQTVQSDAALRSISGEYGLSQGRAALMRALIAENPALTYQTLSALTVNELALMLSSKSTVPDGLSVRGKAADSGMIGTDRAVEIALERAGIPRDGAQNIETEIDLEAGLLVYDVEFQVGGIEHEYKIHTRSGEVLEWELEWQHEIIRDARKD